MVDITTAYQEDGPRKEEQGGIKNQESKNRNKSENNNANFKEWKTQKTQKGRKGKGRVENHWDCVTGASHDIRPGAGTAADAGDGAVTV